MPTFEGRPVITGPADPEPILIESLDAAEAEIQRLRSALAWATDENTAAHAVLDDRGVPRDDAHLGSDGLGGAIYSLAARISMLPSPRTGLEGAP